MQHKCIKPACGASYEDNDPDDYYCPPCNEQRKVIAREIDTKLASVPSKRQATGTFAGHDFKKPSGRIFFNAKDVM